MKFFRETWAIFKAAGTDWMADRADQLGAALAFYSILSVAPLLIVAIAIAATAFGEEAARGELVSQIQGMVGAEGAQAVQAMLKHARRPGAGVLATILGIITLLFGATGVFGQLQSSLNQIWDVAPRPGRGIWGVVRDRLLSLAMVGGAGFLLLVSLVMSTVIAAMSHFLSTQFPGADMVWQRGSDLVSLLMITLILALIYRYLPDAKVAWRDVVVGAIVTALLFTVGKLLIGIYLGRSALGSAYGAAGSFVVLIVWIYYSSQIIFFGAELTQAYARRDGQPIVPKPGATLIGNKSGN
jgi:membrane protein